MAIKAKAKAQGDVVEVKVLMKHEMETGRRVDSETGEAIPAHHITEFVCNWNAETVFTGNLGPAVSKNPYLSFKLRGPAVGDKLTFSWIDNTGGREEGEVVIK